MFNFNQKLFFALVAVVLGLCAISVTSEVTTTTSSPATSADEQPFSTLEQAEDAEEPQLCNATFTEPLPEASKKFVSVCYATEAKVLRLIDTITWTIKILAAPGTNLANEETQLKNDTNMRHIVSMCSNRRIESLIEDISEVAHRLWVLSIRLQEPCDSDVLKVDKMKIDLMNRLQAIRVYSSKSALSPHPMLVQSYEVLLEELKYVFNSAFVMFQTPRPTRPPSPFGPVPIPQAAYRSDHTGTDSRTFPYDPIISSILKPNNSVWGLVELAQDHPKSMTLALPQLMANWYAGNPANFDEILKFVQRLPSLVQKILAHSALHDQLREHGQLETFELTKLADQVHKLNQSVSEVSETIPLSVRSKLLKLVREFGPIYEFFGRNSSCHIKNTVYSRYFYPYSSSYTVLHPSIGDNAGQVITVSPANNSMFELTYNGNNGTLYAWKTTYDSKRRYVSHAIPSSVPATAFKYWKLIAVQGGKYFRILNAKYNEIVFADMDAIDGNSYRRVFLTRSDYSGSYTFVPNADVWNFECTRGSL